MCNQVWMKRHCKKMCGLCTPPEEEALSTSSDKETSGQKRKARKTFLYIMNVGYNVGSVLQ